MHGGTDHPQCSPGFVGWTDEDDRVWAPRLLTQERSGDTSHASRVYFRMITWLALFFALGIMVTALSKGNWLAVVAGLMAVVLAFCPRINMTDD